MSRRSGDSRISIAAAALAILLLTVARQALADPVEYWATVDRERIALDETVTLTVQLSSDQDAELGEIRLPEAPDFEIVHQGRSEQTSFSFVGGSTSFRKTRVWTMVLRPLRQGKLAILPGRVEVGGKRWETGRLTVEVGPARGGGTAQGAPQRPRGFPPIPGLDDDPFEALLGGGPEPSESDLFLRATVDEQSVHVGEQITLSIWLFSRVDVSHVEGLKMPRLDGFWVEELETPRQLAAQSRVIDGVRYRAYLVQRRALFPVRAGEIAIDPVELDVYTGRSFFGRTRQHHRKSPVATIRVEELPGGAPPAFRRGNVGRWDLRVEVEPQKVEAGEPVTVRVVAQGEGNLQAVELPSLPPIDGLKAFEPTHSQEVQIRNQRYGGSKSLEWVLVPERAGSFEIPAIEFAYFDPAEGAYREIRTAPIALTVLPGQGAAVAQAQPTPTPPQERKDEGGLQPLRQAPVIVAAREPIWERPWFLAALAAPALAAFGVAASPLLRRRNGGGRRRSGRRAAAGGLAPDVRTLAERGDPAFFAACERALLVAAAARLGRQVQGMQRAALIAALEEAGVGAEAAARMGRALEACERGRYAPGAAAPEAIAEALADAEEAIRSMEDRA